MMKERNVYLTMLRIINPIFCLGMIAVNALANILPINGMNTGEISDYYPNLFTPIAWTFSIWGVIYLLLAMFMLYQSGLFGGKQSGQLIGEIGIWFVISCTANMLWIFLWHHLKIGLTVCAMLVLLVSLIVMARKVSNAVGRESLFVKLPIFVYFGWITVATIANVTAFFVNVGWSGFGLSEAGWTLIMLLAGALIAASVIVRFRSTAYGAVVIWAYAGILAKHLSASGYDKAFPSVIYSAAIGIAIVLIVCIYVLVRRRRKSDRTSVPN